MALLLLGAHDEAEQMLAVRADALELLGAFRYASREQIVLIFELELEGACLEEVPHAEEDLDMIQRLVEEVPRSQ
jgi:hypothetical protein